MDIVDKIVKNKIDDDFEDLVLCVDDIVFEQSINCKNIFCKDYKKSFKVKGNIDAGNIDALNIDALNIDAKDIVYFSVCFARETFKCVSVKGMGILMQRILMQRILMH